MAATAKETKVHDVFESIASRYDRMNGIISFQLHKRWRKDTMKRMAVPLGAEILDLCCGTGDWAFALNEAVGPIGQVTGVDFSEEMLTVAQEKALKKQQTQILWQTGNAMALSFPNESFDYVTIGFGLRNVADRQQVLAEIHRVLRPSGKIVCLETSQPTLIGWRQLFTFYFHYVMPFFGKLFAKSYQEYSWLQESARDFPDKETLANEFQAAGFGILQVKSYAGGAAAMHMGIKTQN
ncbi:demethylmenaquinone methyltransferase [Enterococcus casseliflavus]|uniref:demethylmenaquinone methyltransferase n=1 Tax=Enterococcus casseliflavus TaxID=37734 RepID=UPI000EAF51CF|nr:demethylmenaquinone methyltransferase [Enterococcus casseliflavus]AYJ46285.1 demethylmenaquinone methyltransferase [Enterococcus casseliflavus]MBX9115723.1 demethylmenaquinone methyltransferase [Enterococcus casseliflavus]MBX9126549.1 demethylmenaquinone methyltransferase [Enterococcus casseliflavus]MDT2979181.1 demethylmenaquinone methyltransferase [Enterococcus casseliflavus]MDY2550061.1 demethylmenaquinone methyltransferase [Enterococcus casseliflavus]